MSLTDQLRKAIHDSGLSLYMVAKATHTPYAVIHGFANEHRNVKLETADKLAELFGMRLTAPKRPKIETAIGRKARDNKGR
jgi:plasmid maintenance system antidote protein VapI